MMKFLKFYMYDMSVLEHLPHLFVYVAPFIYIKKLEFLCDRDIRVFDI